MIFDNQKIIHIKFKKNLFPKIKQYIGVEDRGFQVFSIYKVYCLDGQGEIQQDNWTIKRIKYHFIILNIYFDIYFKYNGNQFNGIKPIGNINDLAK